MARRVLAFFALSCAVTWGGNLGNQFWPSEFWMVPMNPLGPLIAAPIVIGWTEGRAGLRDWLARLRRLRAPAGVYATAFFIPLGIIVASFGLTVALGAAVAPLPRIGIGEVLLTVAVVPFFGPVPEEMSFRGYGLDRLQRAISPLAASLWIGLGVIVWHIPLLLTGDLPLTVLLPLAGVAVVYGRLYRSGGSVWPLVVLHGQLNVCSALVTGPMMPERADQAIYLAILGVFYICWAALIVLRTGPDLAGRTNPGMPMPV